MITVFYGRQVYGEYIAWKEMWKHITVSDTLYQEGYVYAPNGSPKNKDDKKWYRCDGTPALLEDVPKTLQMLTLVLNL